MLIAQDSCRTRRIGRAAALRVACTTIKKVQHAEERAVKWQGARLAGQQVFTAGLKGGSDVVQREIGKIGVRFWHRLAAITNRTPVARS